MKKRILIVLAASITLAIYLTGCFSNGKNAELGERYDSDKVVMFSPTVTDNENYQEKYSEVYENYLKTASETQFVIHQKTALEIALAVIKEIYPNETFQIGGPMNMPRYGPAFYEEGNCWVVTLKNKDYPKDYYPEHLYWVGVYIDVNSGAVRAIIPQNAFEE
jgi:hypothetical protein